MSGITTWKPHRLVKGTLLLGTGLLFILSFLTAAPPQMMTDAALEQTGGMEMIDCKDGGIHRASLPGGGLIPSDCWTRTGGDYCGCLLEQDDVNQSAIFVPASMGIDNAAECGAANDEDTAATTYWYKPGAGDDHPDGMVTKQV